MSKEAEQKAERLAAALRANLRRRKAQARGGDQANSTGQPSDDTQAASE